MIKMREEQKSLWQRTSFDCWSNWDWNKKDIHCTILDFGYENILGYKIFYLQVLNFVIDVEVEKK